MKIIVGLGNIGKEYEETRHNVGFMVADELADRLGMKGDWRKDREAEFIEFRVPEKVVLIKPTTYMNLSGRSVGAWASFYNVDPEDIIIIHDDMDLPTGKLRIRKKGSGGGHRGIKSIIQHLGTNVFTRIRVGIGHPAHEEQAVINHVLQRFKGEDRKIIYEAVDKAADAVEMWLKEDGNTDSVMQKFN